MKIIFLIGAGRSGTTWLQLMLGARPEIATGQESQIFDKYVGRHYQTWIRERDFPENENVRKHGISSYISEDEFVDLMRVFCESVFSKVFRAKEGAVYFLEKSPSNSFHAELMHRCFPDAMYIHLIRDGRDVVASMLAAGEGWGKAWAPKHAADCAVWWKRSVSKCLDLSTNAKNYIEVRYEELLSDGNTEMMRVFDFLGIEVSREEVESIVEAHTFGKLKSNDYDRSVFINTGEASASGTSARPEPKGFFRKGRAGGWQDSLSERDLEEVYWVAGDLLEQLGYINSEMRPRKEPGFLKRRRSVASAKKKLKSLAKSLLG